MYARIWYFHQMRVLKKQNAIPRFLLLSPSNRAPALTAVSEFTISFSEFTKCGGEGMGDASKIAENAYLCLTKLNAIIQMNKSKKIVQPPFLKAGDKVALVSPAYWVPQEALTADERAADLLWAFEDDTIKAVICSRGGYGSIHLLSRIALECFQQHPKWLIGHGDITILLYAVAAAGVMSIHGPMAFQIASSQEPATTLVRNILFGMLPQFIIPGNPYNRIGHAEGTLVGGNLSSYSAIAGTKFHLPFQQDIILFVEEVEESLHGIDRLFYMLRLQIMFENVKGIIFGTFNSIKYDLQYGSVEQMLVAHLQDFDIPICCGFPVGSNSCIPLIEGAPCSLDVTADSATLTFKMKGTVEHYDVIAEAPHLMKEKEL